MDTCTTCSSAANSQCSTAIILALLVIFLAVVAIALNKEVLGGSATEQTNQATSHIHDIGSQGRRAMDALSEQYLDDLYKQVTANMEETHNPSARR